MKKSISALLGVALICALTQTGVYAATLPGMGGMGGGITNPYGYRGSNYYDGGFNAQQGQYQDQDQGQGQMQGLDQYQGQGQGLGQGQPQYPQQAPTLTRSQAHSQLQGQGQNQGQNQGQAQGRQGQGAGINLYGNIPAGMNTQNNDIYMVQDGDALWLIMGNIKARLDTLIYQSPESQSRSTLVIPLMDMSK